MDCLVTIASAPRGIYQTPRPKKEHSSAFSFTYRLASARVVFYNFPHRLHRYLGDFRLHDIPHSQMDGVQPLKTSLARNEVVVGM
jgi:hypothetical protein